MRKTLFLAACWGLALITALTGAQNDMINWGLSYPKNGTTPAVNPTAAALLEKYDGMYVGDTTQKQVYLTFDLGYEAGYTAEVLDILHEHQIPGLFFLCGNYLKQTDLIARMQNEGHQLGNHTVKHKNLAKLDAAGVREELGGLQLPTPAKFFRPPEGSFDEQTLQVAKELNLRAVLWSLAIVDWKKSPKLNVTLNLEKILERVHPGAIMLFHITNPGTPELLRALIPALKKHGYTFGAIS